MEFSELIPELSLWNNGRGIEIDQWICGIGNYEHAIAYGHLFWPEFLEHDGCILRKAAFTVENYRSWLDVTRGDKTAIERVMNHVHLHDLFPNATATDQQALYLAEFLKELWECKLKRDFPGISTVVELSYCEPRGEEWTDCQITIRSLR